MKPGASRTKVGGRYDADTLIVAVNAPATDGRATEAALKALAKALGCRERNLQLVTGVTARTKVVDIPDECAKKVSDLLEG